MRASDFDRTVERTVAPTVEPWGFTSGGGRGCTFHRPVRDDLFHFIYFEQRAGGGDFEVWVFPGSPLLGEEQWTGFPDFVGVPTGRSAGLNAKLGVGGGASRFSCRDTKALEVALAHVVLPALQLHALGYLSNFQSVQDIIPVLEHQQWASLLAVGRSD